MGVNQILELVKQLPYVEQLTVAEAILHSILQQQRGHTYTDEEDARLSIAAEALFSDYEKDEELTVFTQLDGESIYEEK
ncbi:MAG: hypothetical protein JNK77_20585 [Saprospiraceae bacterium]|nr:hypothetical protein [Saprospiraceae bacterium]